MIAYSAIGRHKTANDFRHIPNEAQLAVMHAREKLAQRHAANVRFVVIGGMIALASVLSLAILALHIAA